MLNYLNLTIFSSHVFFHRGSALAGTFTITVYANDKKANIPFLFVCSGRTTERVGNELPSCLGLTEFFLLRILPLAFFNGSRMLRVKRSTKGHISIIKCSIIIIDYSCCREFAIYSLNFFIEFFINFLLDFRNSYLFGESTISLRTSFCVFVN